MSLKQLSADGRYAACASALKQARTNWNAFTASKTNRTLLTLAGCAVASGIGTYLYARSEAKRFRLETIRIKTTAPRRNGSELTLLRILHISDSHLSAPEKSKVEFLKRVTDADYDLVLITGDIYENYSGVQYTQDILSRQPRLGAYAVLGNHDYFDYKIFNKTFGRLHRRFRHPAQRRDVDPMIEALTEAGITVLRNSSVTMPEEKLHLIGLDYPGTTQEHLINLANEVPSDFLKLAILHLPRRLHQLPTAGIDVAFAGHTHGGQIRLPGFGALITDSELARHEASGVVQRGDTMIHVSRGLSADPRTNFRLFCPPAVTVVEIEHYPRG